MVEISSKSFTKSSFRLSTKNAWAKYVRARWPINTLAEIQRAWDLTEGQARGVLYAQASQSTIDAVLDALSPVQAFSLSLEILCIRLNTSLEEYITHQAKEASRERAQWEAEERRLEALASRLPGGLGVAGADDQPPGSGGPTDAGLGRSRDGAPRRLTGQARHDDTSRLRAG